MSWRPRRGGYALATVTVAFLTDVEGQWSRLATFAQDNPHVRLEAGDQLVLADGITFVFGGDVQDRGPAARRLMRTLLSAKARYGERVTLLAGNRDLNKLRLLRELGAHPPPRAPTGLSRAELLRWIFSRTMGAAQAFAHRAAELAAEGEPEGDEAVVDSYLADLDEEGLLRRYLGACRLAFRAGATLFVHGAVTEENLLRAPTVQVAAYHGGQPLPLGPKARDVDEWVEALQRFYADSLLELSPATRAQDRWTALVAYQAPVGGQPNNPWSVVYGHPTDACGNPHLPTASVVEGLRQQGISRVVVGHTPSGDCPAVLRDGRGFELWLADNNYSRVETSSQLFLSDPSVRVAARTVLDDGVAREVRFELAQSEVSPLGLRDSTGRLIKARLDSDSYLGFRGLPGFGVEQTVVGRSELAGPLLPPWCIRDAATAGE